MARHHAAISFWLETSGDDLTPRPPLDGSTEVDVAILGAGFTGLWTAHSLLRADPSLRILLIEREIAGFGASDKPDVAYDREFHLETLDAVAGDGPVTLVGHSLGGLLGALWASSRPGRVAGMAIVAAPFPSADGGQDRKSTRLNSSHT